MVFSYKAINRSGELKVGTLECLSQSGAVLELGRMHLVPVEIRAASRHLPPWLTDQYHYGAYGEPPTTDAATGNPFRYTGRYLDAETGLYYYRARYYSAKLGRFLQTDPIGTKDDLDLYAYTGNDPLNGTDPTGHTDCKSEGGKTTCDVQVTGSHIPNKISFSTSKGVSATQSSATASSVAPPRVQSQTTDTAQSQTTDTAQGTNSDSSLDYIAVAATKYGFDPTTGTVSVISGAIPGAGGLAGGFIPFANAVAANADAAYQAINASDAAHAKGESVEANRQMNTYYYYCGCSSGAPYTGADI